MIRGIALLAGAFAIHAAPAGAITYGYVDTQNAYPNVGAYVLKAPDRTISPICSGTLIAPRVFLTASHCTAAFQAEYAPQGYTAYVSFDNPIPWGERTTRATRLIPVTSVVNPAYDQRQADPGDIGAAVLPRNAASAITPAPLPAQGLLDRLFAAGSLQTATFTAVGYGTQDRVTGGGTPSFTDSNPEPRRYAFGSFNALNAAWLRLSGNPATGDGGTCYGDSGGPNLLPSGGRLLVAGITITGDAVCRATNVDYRTDTRPARAFLRFVSSTYGVTISLP